jgi:hypothetical protein
MQTLNAGGDQQQKPRGKDKIVDAAPVTAVICAVSRLVLME